MNTEKYMETSGDDPIFDALPIGALLFDGTGRLAKVNRAFLDLCGVRDMSQLTSHGLLDDPLLGAAHKDRLRQGESVQLNAKVFLSDWNWDPGMSKPDR